MKPILTQTLNNTQTLDEFLDSYYFSRKQKHLLKMEKRIKVNQQIITHNITLNSNDVIEIDCESNESNNLIPYDYPINVLYEDEVILVVDKPISMIVHDDGNHTITLDRVIANYYLKTNQVHPVYHVHRLDKDTSGCILYCKQSYLLPYFDALLAKKEIKRTYLAICQGIINKSITINQKIGKDRHVNNRYRVSKTGLDACTHVKPIKSKNNNTLVECCLETGRTHQIRVHLSSINHPLIGDEIYGKKEKMRCALHSHTLTLKHPITQKTLVITSSLPIDMQECMK